MIELTQQGQPVFILRNAIPPQLVNPTDARPTTFLPPSNCIDIKRIRIDRADKREQIVVLRKLDWL